MKRPINILLGAITLLLNAGLTFLNLSEWYVVGVQGRTEGYPFGGESPTPYYYQTAELYSTVTLIWGIIFLAVLLLAIWTVWKGKQQLNAIAFGLTITLLLGLFIHGQIGAY
ncbi:MAG: hypothetical protein AAGI38_05645 [Bacteroidota bacterium]